MNCPNCGSENIVNNKCSSCFVDVTLYQKIVDTSNLLYNEGLSKAKSKDLSGAAESLSKALRYNKKNINARNLLGLILFETGRLGEAYELFILSLSHQKTDNIAQKYIDIINSSSHKIDTMKDSVRIYNQGLTYLNQKSDDIAIIQFKKAIDINPTFVDALNLLALTYIYQKNNTKAMQIIDKTLAFDIKNPKALKYRSEIIHTVPGRRYDSALELKSPKKNTLSYVESNKKRGIFSGSGIFSIIYIFIGFFVSFLIFFVLIMPGITQRDAELIAELNDKNEVLEASLTEITETKENEIKRLEASTEELETQKKLLEEKVNTQSKREVLNEAQNYINNGQYEEASDLLYSLDPTGLPADLSDKRSELVSEAYPRACSSLYYRATSRYRARDYDGAETLFNECIKYADTDSNFAGDSYYYLAEIYYTRDDKIQSKELFEKVVAEYPKSNFYWIATNRLNNRF